jgi:hypothetical protein
MAVMDRIEGAAVDRDLFQCSTLNLPAVLRNSDAGGRLNHLQQGYGAEGAQHDKF